MEKNNFHFLAKKRLENQTRRTKPTMKIASTLLLLTTTTTAYVTTPEHFGAVGDGKTNDWHPIQQALASCTNTTDHYCRIDFTQTYMSGPLQLATSNTTLNVTGNLLMLPKDTYDYPHGLPFIGNAGTITNVRVTGGGTIGNHILPVKWWACKLTGCFRPHLITFRNVVGVRMDNLHLRNPPNHFVEMDSCTNVRVNNMNMKAPHESPNSDGINFYGGQDQSLTNSLISNGDDCVSVVPIGEGTDACANGDPAQPSCRGGNVRVRNVTCEGGHGIAIGGIRHGTVSNVTFENMTATGGFGNTQGLYSPGGIRIKSYPGSRGSVYDVHYKDIVLDGVYTPLSVLTRYCPWPCTAPDSKVHACQFHDISFDNVRGTGRSEVVGFFNCSTIKPCYNISLNNVVLGTPGKATIKCSESPLTFTGESSPKECSPM